MKKAYVKPQIYFESFALSQNIAAGCEFTIDGHAAGGCGYAYEGGGGQTLFTAQVGTSVCSIPIDDDANNEFCYHVPLDDKNLFNS